jgi:hypothetical protein
MLIKASALRYFLCLLPFWLFPFVLRFAPLGLSYPSGDLSVYIILILWALLFAVFYYCGSRLALGLRYSQIPSRSVFGQKIQARIIFYCLLSFLGAVILLIEYSVFRGYGLFTPVAEIRILEVNAVIDGRAASILSGLARILLPSILLAWTLYLNRTTAVKRSVASMLIVCTLVVLLVQAKYEGGRFFLFALVGIFCFSSFLGAQRRSLLKLGKPKSFLYASVVAFAIVYVGYVFLDRLAGSADLSAAYVLFANRLDISVSSEAMNRLSGPWQAFWFPLMMMVIYISHPISELCRLIQAPGLELAFGSFQLVELKRLLALIGVDLGFDVFKSLPKAGVYLTLPGANYVDFSYAGFFLSPILWGLLAGFSLALYDVSLTPYAIIAPLVFVCMAMAMIHSIVTTVWPAFVWAFVPLPPKFVVKKRRYV